MNGLVCEWSKRLYCEVIHQANWWFLDASWRRLHQIMGIISFSRGFMSPLCHWKEVLYRPLADARMFFFFGSPIWMCEVARRGRRLVEGFLHLSNEQKTPRPPPPPTIPQLPAQPPPLGLPNGGLGNSDYGGKVEMHQFFQWLAMTHRLIDYINAWRKMQFSYGTLLEIFQPC